jgi:hypothetical protein
MRRALASLLLALFSFPLIFPVLSAETAGNLPACCRREGQHHCVMAAQTANSGSPSIQARCPQFPRINALAVSLNPVLLSASVQTGAPFMHFLGAKKTNENLPQIALRGAERKRGPPSSLD